MWENISKSQGCLGGAIWSGIDDTFFPPNGDTIGYGTWGPIDGWRRPKPEYWHMKKAYSPLRILERAVPANQPARLSVENRYSFTDLSEVRFDWKCGWRSGSARTSATPGKTGMLEIPVRGDGKLLHVSAIGPRGYVEDEWDIALGADPCTALPLPSVKSGTVTIERPAGKIVVRAPGYTVTFDAATGMPTAPFKGPDLLMLPTTGDACGGMQMTGKEKDVAIYSDTCHNWKAKEVKAEPEADGGVTVRVEGSYTEAQGCYTFRFAQDGTLTVNYDFSSKVGCNPRQIGVVFRLPRECDTLTWRRNAHWSFYPDDHIARRQGTAPAFIKGVPLSGLAGARVQPSWSWSADGNKYGSNDFRSTKMNILEAALLSARGHGLRVLSDGSQHVRSWIDGSMANLLVAEYSNHGSPAFFNEHVIPGRPLHEGSVVKGTVRLEVR